MLKPSSLKVVAVTYERWSFTRGSTYKALTKKILVFWISDRLWEVVAYEKWSFTTGSTYKALTKKIGVFWISGCLWEVVAHAWWSYNEV